MDFLNTASAFAFLVSYLLSFFLPFRKATIAFFFFSLDPKMLALLFFFLYSPSYLTGTFHTCLFLWPPPLTLNVELGLWESQTILDIQFSTSPYLQIISEAHCISFINVFPLVEKHACLFTNVINTETCLDVIFSVACY